MSAAGRDSTLRLAIGPALIRFDCALPGADLGLPNVYRPFLDPPPSAEPGPGARYDVLPAPPPFPAPPPADWGNDAWRLRRAGPGLAVDVRDALDAAWRPAGEFSADLAAGRLYPRAGRHPDGRLIPLHPPFDRPLLLARLAFLGGAMLHAACVADGGRALFLAGPSGSGKTSFARLWREHGATLLNDERNLAWTEGEAAHAAASPWHGEEREVRPARAPLAAILHLRHARAPRLRRLRPTEALTRLAQTAFLPVFLPAALKKTVDTLGRLAAAVPSYELEFPLDPSAVRLCREELPDGAR